MEREEILKKLSNSISKRRFEHCLGAEQMALQLAPRFGVKVDKVTPAALLHDLCREYDRQLLLQLSNNFGIVIDDIERVEPMLLHGVVGAVLVRTELGINDPEILEAITFHITGGPNLCELTKLIFVADYIEPGRTNEQARILREEAFRLKPAELLLKIYNATITYVVNRDYLLHPRSIDGRNELIVKGIS